MTAKVTIITPTYAKPELFRQCVKSVLAQTYQDWTWWIVYNFDNSRSDSHYNFDHLVDKRIIPIFYPVMPETRSAIYIPAVIVNLFYPKVETKYIYWLSDDDLIDKYGLAVLVNAAEPVVKPVDGGVIVDGDGGKPVEKESYDAVYGGVEVQDEQPDGSFKTGSWTYPGVPITDVLLSDGKDKEDPVTPNFDVGLNTSVTDVDCRIDSSQILHTKALWDLATADGWRLTENMEDAGHADGILLNRLAQFATFHYVPQRINVHRRTQLSELHKPQL